MSTLFGEKDADATCFEGTSKEIKGTFLISVRKRPLKDGFTKRTGVSNVCATAWWPKHRQTDMDRLQGRDASKKAWVRELSDHNPVERHCRGPQIDNIWACTGGFSDQDSGDNRNMNEGKKPLYIFKRLPRFVQEHLWFTTHCRPL